MSPVGGRSAECMGPVLLPFILLILASCPMARVGPSRLGRRTPITRSPSGVATARAVFGLGATSGRSERSTNAWFTSGPGSSPEPNERRLTTTRRRSVRFNASSSGSASGHEDRSVTSCSRSCTNQALSIGTVCFTMMMLCLGAWWILLGLLVSIGLQKFGVLLP